MCMCERSSVCIMNRWLMCFWRAEQRHRGFQAPCSPQWRLSPGSWLCCCQRHSTDLFRRPSKRSRVGLAASFLAVLDQLETVAHRSTRRPPSQPTRSRWSKKMWKMKALRRTVRCRQQSDWTQYRPIARQLCNEWNYSQYLNRNRPITSINQLKWINI